MFNNVLSHLHRSSLKRKVRDVFFSALYGLSSQISSVIFSIIAIHFFSKDFWGAYSQVLVMMYIFLMVCNWGNRDYIVTRETGDFKKLFSKNFSTRLLVLLVSVLFIFCIVHEHTLIVVLILINRFFCQSFDVVISKERKFIKVLKVEMMIVVLFVVASYISKIMVEMSFDYFLIVLTSLEFIRSALYMYFFKELMPQIQRSNFSIVELSQSFPFLLNALVGFFTSRLDFFVSTIYLSKGDIALYQVMFNYVFLFQAFANLIFYTYVFQFFKLNAEQKNRFIRKYYFIGFLISLFFVCGIIPLLMLNNMYIDFKMATILTCFVFLGFLQQPFIYALYQRDRTILISGIGLFSIILFLIMFVSFLFIMGKPDLLLFIYAGLIAQMCRSVLFMVSGREFIRT